VRTPEPHLPALTLSASPLDAVVEPMTATAFARLCEDALPRVYAYVRSQVAHAAVAEEIVGRVFLKATSCSHLPAGDRRLLAFRTATTTLIDYRCVEGRREAVAIEVDEIEMPRAGTPDPEAALLRKERAVLLFQAMGDLEPNDRTLLALKFAGRRTNREIAAILDISGAAVSMRLLRAMRRLREHMRGRGL
jgi:RNA polymerase sigma-70 factor (ECF subfamily)